MKKFGILIAILFNFCSTFAQSEKNGNPVFNSVSTKEASYADGILISNYYTLFNNIENKNSSVFICNDPTLSQIEDAAVKLLSDFFILTKDNKIQVMIMLQNEPKRQFMVVEMKTNQQNFYACSLEGLITENRASEIIKEKYDSDAYIKNGKLYFNGNDFNIISTKDLEQAVIELIKKEKLNEVSPSDYVLPSKQELKNYVLAETKEGGKFDFFTEVKDKNEVVQVKPGVFSTLQNVALYKWGRACFDLGINTVDDSHDIFSTYKNGPLNENERVYIRMGFYKELEKD